jgi:hypothetical protein
MPSFEILLVMEHLKIPGQLRDPNQRQTSSDRYLEEQKSEKSNQFKFQKSSLIVLTHFK